jgi:hypothetical protein
MEQHFLNTELSETLYNKYKRHIKAKECYTNIFFLLSKEFSKFESGEWRIAYGFVSSIDCIYCRHCFTLEKDGMVVDPTMFSAERDTTQSTYFGMKVFDELKEYISAIDAENGYPSLAKYLWSVEMKAQAWGNKNGYFFIG